MNWSSIKETVAKFAPLAGTLLGGPAAPAIGALISSALGSDNTPEAVMQSLANPENVVKLKELESSERKHLLEMQVEELKSINAYNIEKLKIETADTQSARVENKQSVMPAVVTGALTLICGALLYSLLYVTIPEQNKDILIQSFGTVLGFWGASIAYWVGTTRSSAEKTKLLGK